MGQEEEFLVFPGRGERSIALEIKKQNKNKKQRRPFHRISLQNGPLDKKKEE